MHDVLAFCFFVFFLVSVSIVIVLMYLLLMNCCEFAVNISVFLSSSLAVSSSRVTSHLTYLHPLPTKYTQVLRTVHTTCTGTGTSSRPYSVLCHKSQSLHPHPLQHRSVLARNTHAFPASHRLPALHYCSRMTRGCRLLVHVACIPVCHFIS